MLFRSKQKSQDFPQQSCAALEHKSEKFVSKEVMKTVAEIAPKDLVKDINPSQSTRITRSSSGKISEVSKATKRVGRGGSNSTSVPPIAPNIAVLDSPEDVRAVCDKVRGGFYVMGPKEFIRYANQTGKSIRVVPVEGDGNCFYRCLAAAGLPLSNCLKPTFKSFKAFILEYFLSDECQSLLNSDLISNYPGFSGFGSEWNRDNLTGHKWLLCRGYPPSVNWQP